MSNLFCGSFGINSKIGVAPSGAIDAALVAATSRLEILGESFIYQDELIGGRGITGSLNPMVTHLRQGQRAVEGGIVFEIGPNELDPWIPALLGNTTADATVTKDTFDKVAHDFTIQRDLVTHGYRHCVLRQASIRGRSNPEDPEDQIVQAALGFIGVEEHAGVTFPALSLSSTERLFWIVADSILEVDTVEFPIISFDITIAYRLIPLFRNKLKIGCFRAVGREVILDVQIPYSSESATALFGANDTNQDVTLKLVSDNLPETYAAYETVFNFPTMRRVNKRATTDSKGEIPLQARFRAYQSGTGENMSITNTITA
jgi:hypothetical protein